MPGLARCESLGGLLRSVRDEGGCGVYEGGDKGAYVQFRALPRAMTVAAETGPQSIVIRFELLLVVLARA